MSALTRVEREQHRTFLLLLLVVVINMSASQSTSDTMATPKPGKRESMANITNSLLPPNNASSSHAKRLSTSSRPAKLHGAVTPQPRRQRTDTEPASVTPRVKTFVDKIGHFRSMQSVNDLAKAADVEPIKAFLRIRPPPPQTTAERPYIQVVSDTEVLMHPPTQSARVRAPASTVPPTKYVFSKVFGGQATAPVKVDEADQSSFFRQTTLPLVDDLLQGQSGLIFTYGVTNSGKSHTVMGNDSPGGSGILPRALDVIFNSISGLESSSEIQPCGVSGIQRVDKTATLTASSSSVGLNPFMIPGLSKKLLGDAISRSLKPSSRPRQHDPTKVAVDRNLRYSVFVSYVEIYNEKLFDLLDASPGSTLGRSDSVRGSNWSLAALANAAPDQIPTSGSITLNRRPLTLKNDTVNGGKYVAGLREIKITSADEARDLLHRGQENRAVFGTMANRASSRSHGVFTIKIVREHAAANSTDGDLSSTFSTARLSIVDLAGSERVSNTGLSGGDRLKEAGNINKSLMCLGQCLETLRKNQVRLVGTADQPQTVKRRMSIVPFRHSKLTELFQSFFTGEGKAVMIVNANPFDTGFDENSHVMKFSAIAKDVATSRQQAVTTKALPSLPKSKLSVSTDGGDKSRSMSEAEQVTDVTIIEEDDQGSDDDSDHDPFVDMLVEKHEELRHKLYAAEMRCAAIEAQVREEMANEMEQRLLEMQDLYNTRMMNDHEQNEQFMNRKLDLLVRTNQAASVDSDASEDEEDEDAVDQSLAPSAFSHAAQSDVSKEVFDSATEGEDEDTSQSQAFASEADDDEDDDQPILQPGRQTQSTAMRGRSVTPDQSIDQSVAQESSDDEDSEEEEGDDEDESADFDQSMSSAQSVEPEDAADSSFDITSLVAAESEDEQAALPTSRRKSGRRSTMNAAHADQSSHSVKTGIPPSGSSTKTLTARGGGRRSSRPAHRDSTIHDAPALTDISDASMIAQDTPLSPKKKRKLRKKATVQEDDFVDQIGDSSLVEAVYQSSTTLAASTRSSLASRKSLRS